MKLYWDNIFLFLFFEKLKPPKIQSARKERKNEARGVTFLLLSISAMIDERMVGTIASERL